jgi:PAS domain-containing protein
MNAADDPTALLAELRAQLEAATTQIEELVAAVAGLRELSDDLESLADVLLDAADVPVLVIDADRRIRGVSAAAARCLEGAELGKPLSSALPEDVYDRVVAGLDEPRAPTSPDGDPRVEPLPGGGAVVVLSVRARTNG